MIHVSAPGKMMIAGEWAVLEPGNACLVAAVNKRVHAEVQEFYPTDPTASEVSFTLEDFGIKERNAKWDGKSLVFSPELSEEEKSKFKFIKEAVETTFNYIKESGKAPKSFALKTWGEQSQIQVDGQKKKIGFGSSASAVVASTAAILLELHGIHVEKNKDLVYKLGLIAHYFAQGKVGSGFDVAAATYGGTFSYIAPDLKKLTEQLQQKSVKQVADSRWPLLHIQPMEVPENLFLAVGWTKSSADTPTMIKAMNAWKESNATAHGSQMEALSETVDKVLEAWRLRDQEMITDLIRQNAGKLRELTQASGVPIETDDLRKLAEIADQNGAAGKLSGAGGGDCGIALVFDEHKAEDIKELWKQAGIYPLDVGLDPEGVKVVSKTPESVGGAEPGGPPPETAEELVHK